MDNVLEGIGLPPDTEDYLQFAANPLDAVTYFDFSDYTYALDPQYAQPPVDPGAMPGQVLDIAESLESEDIDSADAVAFAAYLRTAFWLYVSDLDRQETGRIATTHELANKFQTGIIRIIDQLYADPAALASFLKVYWALQTNTARKELLTWIVTRFTELAISQSLGAKWFFYFALSRPEEYNTARYRDESIRMHWLVMEGWLLAEWTDESPYSVVSTESVGTGPAEEFRCNPPTEHPFNIYANGSFNLGIRLLYRQEWRTLGNQRGELVKTVPLGPKQVEKVSTKIIRRQKLSQTSEDLKSVETSTETQDTSKDSSEVVREAAKTFGWNVQSSASGSFGIVSGSASAGAQGSSENRSRYTSNMLSESMQKTASKVRNETKVVVSTEVETTFEEERASEISNPNEEIALTYVYSKLQRQYEVLTRLIEAQDVVYIAERVPQPSEVTDEWIRRYDWIIARSLLDDSLRDALTSISREVVTGTDVAAGLSERLSKVMDQTVDHLGKLTSTSTNLRLDNVDVARESQAAYAQAAKDLGQKHRDRQADLLKRCRLRLHIIDNILHYCQAIWDEEHPQQRILRYQKLNAEVPLEWEFHGTFGGVQDTWKLQELIDEIASAQDPEGSATFLVDGEFRPTEGGKTTKLVDLIANEKPIGYFGNYAVYSLRPELAGKEIPLLLQVLKTPYLDYEPDSNGVLTARLSDPAFREYQRAFDGKAPANDAEKSEMVDYVPELRRLYQLALGEKSEDQFMRDPQEDIFPKHYAEYRFRKDMSRRFPVDSNNLVVDILPGFGSALEQFKRSHRIIDAFKAREELVKMNKENERRELLLASDNFGDPDIEKVTVVAANDRAARNVNVSILDDDRSPGSSDGGGRP